MSLSHVCYSSSSHLLWPFWKVYNVPRRPIFSFSPTFRSPPRKSFSVANVPPSVTCSSFFSNLLVEWPFTPVFCDTLIVAGLFPFYCIPSPVPLGYTSFRAPPPFLFFFVLPPATYRTCGPQIHQRFQSFVRFLLEPCPLSRIPPGFYYKTPLGLSVPLSPVPFPKEGHAFVASRHYPERDPTSSFFPLF